MEQKTGSQGSFCATGSEVDRRVGLGRIGQCCLLQDAEACEAVGNLRRNHSGTVIAQTGARQPTLLEGLAETMGDDLCGLRQIPLQAAVKASAVVEHAEQDRRYPLAPWR